MNEEKIELTEEKIEITKEKIKSLISILEDDTKDYPYRAGCVSGYLCSLLGSGWNHEKK